MARTILAVIAGALVAALTIVAVEFAGQLLFPPIAIGQPDDVPLGRLLSAMPTGALAMIAAAWIAGAFTGGFVAARLSHRHKRGAAIAVALLVMAGVVGMIYLVPEHPVWVTALGLFLPIPVAVWAARLGNRSQTQA